ncbi:Putative E3 ubiquitin-protein ligase LIN [Seminavis robusta]|uniref:RING-type E3 ubiquitin transferase n=1 Tax=Seminavis robusta TaxID=568900 RepID=A0A9N8EQV9_9STRA|nr:Putative E3 ubiquitin-protein ligase LIN [Seminavis robusta]|eukprot:Sro1366_g266640.1 Putative E3 ubiquitin-protein ligase LIN (281) ;mRNA; f:6422-7336
MSTTGANKNLDTMSYRQLQLECQRANLRASGKAQVLRKRLRQSKKVEATQPPAKRPTKSAADDLICPISLELPWDPVTAEDGRVYERECIEEHIKKNPGNLTSPITREKMGTRIFPAIQHRNTIETLIESGVIDGDLAAKWNEKVEQKKQMEELLKKAEAGDADAMYSVGVYYFVGNDGFKQDDKLAFHWYKRAHEARNIMGTAMLAAGGSDVGAYNLGFGFAKGEYGLSATKSEAIYWLTKVTGKCRVDHLSDSSKKAARKLLHELITAPPAAAVTFEF